MPTLSGHLAIARIDHWFKNVFMVPGVVAGLALAPAAGAGTIWIRLPVGVASVCLVASSNYTLNEVLDGPYDRLHPLKHTRPVVAGKVHVPLAYLQWIGLGAVGISVGATLGAGFAATVAALWVMGCLYNLPPVRTKDLPYLDVLSEAVNNPLRMLAGWAVVAADVVPPVSLLASYWMVGCYFMALKRFAELREIADPARAAAYRRSFAVYTEQRLLVSVMFYGAAAMLFLGAFVMRYRMEMILGFPCIAWVMATYLELSFAPGSAVQRPESLYRQPRLMAAVTVCAALLAFLFVRDVPIIHRIFSPSVFADGR